MAQSIKEHSVVAIYESHGSADAAIKSLQHAGLDMKKFSLVGKDSQGAEHALGFYALGDRIKFCGGRGALWGGQCAILFGGAFFFVPSVGTFVVLGPFVAAIVSAFEAAAVDGAAGVLSVALTSIGIPGESIAKYDAEVKAGKFLVLGRGSQELMEKARGALGASGASQLTAHAA